MDLPLAIDEGIDTAAKIAKRYGFAPRQAEYYIEATEILGLIRRQGKKLELSSDGRKYLNLDVPQRKIALIRRILTLPVVSYSIAELIANASYSMSKGEMRLMVTEVTGISGSTIGRRSHTIMAWLKWVGDETGVFEVKSGAVKLLVNPKPSPI